MAIEIKKQMINRLNPENAERFIIIAEVNGKKKEVYAPLLDSPEPEGGPTNRGNAQADCMLQLAAME